MQLIMSPNSPFARKVRILIREAGQTEEVEEVSVSTSALNTPESLAAVNPLGRIPVLVRDDGMAIHDSRVITRYLDDLWSVGFYPSSGLWEVMTREATADGLLDCAVAMVYEQRLRPEERRWQAWLDAQWAKVSRTLDMFEAVEDGTAPLDMGRIGLGAALGYLDFRHDLRDWRKGRPRLAAWFQSLSGRPSFTATAPG